MFGITEETQEVKTGGGKHIFITSLENAIRDDIEIKSLELSSQEGKDSVFKIIVKDNSNREQNRWYYQPNGAYPREKWDSGQVVGIENKEEATERGNKEFSAIMMNIAHRFLGQNYITGPVKSFDEFVKKVIDDIGDKYIGVKLRCVFNIKNDGFTTLRGFTPIFENMSVAKASSNLILSKRETDNIIDNLNKEKNTKPDSDVNNDSGIAAEENDAF